MYAAHQTLAEDQLDAAGRDQSQIPRTPAADQSRVPGQAKGMGTYSAFVDRWWRWTNDFGWKWFVLLDGYFLFASTKLKYLYRDLKISRDILRPLKIFRYILRSFWILLKTFEDFLRVIKGLKSLKSTLKV